MPYSSQEYLQRFMMHCGALTEAFRKNPGGSGEF
jgi:hypothetical protein